MITLTLFRFSSWSLILYGLLLCHIIHGQKLNFYVRLNYEKIAAQTDVRIMKELEVYMQNFINSRQWVKSDFDQRSEITGNILLTLDNVSNNSRFSGFLNIQVERLIYNSSYRSTLFNYRDNDIKFDFGINQMDFFNENTFMSADNVMQMNLPAILAFYVHLIIGLDYDSYSLYRGSQHFNIALQIASNAASNSTISSGWKPFETNRNRFILVNELNSEQFKYLHVAIYKYFRLCLDQLYESKEKALAGLTECLEEFNQLKSKQISSLHLILFMDVHKNEMMNILDYERDAKNRNKLLQIIKNLN